jgi:DNA phosphorothioation-associated putative methyltransferase
MTLTVARHRTALNRRELSRPIRLAVEDGLINPETEVLDYGCGRGDDLRLLTGIGIQCHGWDPVHFPTGERQSADVVNLGYVVNVIEDVEERVTALQKAWALTQKLLIVSARLTVEAKDAEFTPYRDGCLTRLATFQKFYQQHELRQWINLTLKVSSVPVAPGIFYVFRDQNLQQSFVASHYRRSAITPRPHRSDLLFEEHKELFEPLMTFIAARGRLPDESEIELADDSRRQIGSLKRAFRIIRSVTGSEQWDQIREARSQDLLIYLALARFTGRPRMSQLPRHIQLDVHAFFSSYSQACTLADELLFSAGNMNLIDKSCHTSSIGKLTGNALYIHESVLTSLPPVLRVYEGCARAYIGAVQGANIIKLHRRIPQISYLAYPEFERDPHPELYASLIVPLQTFHIKYLEYIDSKNPPILHRKEEFIAADHPLSSKFAKLTYQEVRHGLYEDTTLIGTREGWKAVLKGKGLRLSGHRLIKGKQMAEFRVNQAIT